MYNYLEEMKKDIREVLEDSFDLNDYRNAEEARDSIYEDLWIDDRVTGNGSNEGYWGNDTAEDAGHCLAGNFDLVGQALRDFGYDDPSSIFDKGEHGVDTLVRCYLLWEALDSVLEELDHEWSDDLDQDDDDDADVDEGEEEAVYGG